MSPDQVIEEKIEPEIEEQAEREKAPEVKKHNLPNSTTSFIGREKEMKEVRDLFHKSRIVTLTGAGGCGKTRLAREIAFMLVEEYKDGVWFIDLSPISDPNFVSKEISDVLNIKEEPDKPIVDTLIESIKEKSLLILLDNCEHLIQECAEIAHKLLNTVKGIRILATSREALNIQGEVVWRIPLMSFPGSSDSIKEIKEINQYEAIRLFVDRADSSQPGFTLNPQNVSSVTQICQRIEGIPLAIELAATRIRHIGLETILERLEDHFKILSSSSRVAPDRQQTLKAAIDWSYDLLSEQEQLLFRRVSVFAGDFSIEAVEEVCSDKELKEGNILTLLSQLVDKSLVIAENQEDGSVRYKCLIPLHQYSLQKLIADKEEDTFRKKHLEYYLKIAEKAYEEQYDAMADWIVKLEKEHDNLCSALEWADQHLPDEYILLTGALAWFWRMQAHFIIGKEYLEKSLAKRKAKSPAIARVLYGLAVLTGMRSGMTKGYELYEESLEIWRELGNLKEQSIVLRELGMLEYGNDNLESGLKYCEESLELARVTGNRGFVNFSTLYVCQGLVFLNYIDRAKPMAEQLLILSKELNQPYGIIAAYHFLGDCALLAENFKEAEKTYAEGMKTSFQFGELFIAINDMIGVAMSVAGQSRFSKTLRLNAAAREQARRLGVLIPKVKFWQDLINKYITGIKDKLTKEQSKQNEEEGRNMGFEAAVKYALDFERD